MSEPNPTILPATVHDHECPECGVTWTCEDEECDRQVCITCQGGSV
ncbi:MAG: hypothetical protein UU61_C0016G0016 [Parcubacteria group bacterium GW2011_GWB1_41_4]|nr:MAG: hypothetical protein UU61_C0016G0016 [Parcubacteria group bacterium GW2011_GWB1_41_4]